MNKNWNDRADKDLFFTILSVKNIGVISGSEWTTIGNHMRTLGYGFTNEGCRQHFQGLRRAQHKSDISSGPSPTTESPRKVDPTQNPITRRPGPGRGRPKKQSQGSQGDGSVSGYPPGPGSDVPSTPGGEPADHMMPGSGPVGVPTAPMGDGHDQPPLSMAQSMSAGQTSMHGDGLVDPDLENSEHIAKRPRLDESHDPSLEDEAVLNALTTHNNPTPENAYVPDFNYGET
ncbi:hypothetical protein B0T17DRAFT_611730 [Bombardia bombarda]|uniref:Myb-like domain-containing protein n=1 Tax=Bombardia bombarda TaxID=252184 RepID=A0AA39XJE8_9PEZI|nr:hypothetical protein B0T17DRAFT_611730 [Bombardia bombarda]